MRNKLFAVSCGVALVAAFLGAPVAVQAQTLTDSVSNLSSADVQRILKDDAAASAQPSTANAGGKSKRSKLILGTVIGAISGAAIGTVLYFPCANEHASGCLGAPFSLGAMGAGVGLMIGSWK